MAKGKDQLAQLVAPVLTPGETLVATARVNYNGTVPPNTVSMNSGLPGLDPVEDTAEIDPDSTLLFPTASQMALALTDGRVFIWSLGVTGKPKQFVGEVPLSGIARVETGAQGYGESMRIHMKSTAIVDLEFMRGESGGEFELQFAELVNDGAEAPVRDAAIAAEGEADSDEAEATE